MITKEAIEAARKAILEHDYNPYTQDGLSAILTAAFAAMPGPAVKVKPLEWVEHWGGSNDDLPSWRGKNPLGLHVSVDFIGKYNLDRHSDAPQDELETAKAAAQADYEARILSALTPAPDIASENERLRAALEAINAAASKEYCASLRQFEEKECLGWESKVVSGKFGKAEHEAHKRANMLMGKAQGLWEAAKIARAALERT